MWYCLFVFKLFIFYEYPLLNHKWNRNNIFESKTNEKIKRPNKKGRIHDYTTNSRHIMIVFWLHRRAIKKKLIKRIWKKCLNKSSEYREENGFSFMMSNWYRIDSQNRCQYIAVRKDDFLYCRFGFVEFFSCEPLIN